MSSGVTKANWHNDIIVDDDDSDPFEVHERGLPIEIGDEEARVSRAMVQTLEREGRLADHGVTCAIKDQPNTTCWACPVYKPPSSKHPISVLCRLGREQDRLVTRLVQLRVEKKQREADEAQAQSDYATLQEAATA